MIIMNKEICKYRISKLYETFILFQTFYLSFYAKMATRISGYDLKMPVGEEEVIPYKTISLQTLERGGVVFSGPLRLNKDAMMLQGWPL